MTAKSARKSPSRLTTCAYHTLRITVRPRTSRNVIETADTGGVVVASAAMGGAPECTSRARIGAMRHAAVTLTVLYCWLTPGGSAALSAGQSAAAASYDLVLKDRRIVDGHRSPALHAGAG